MKNLSYWEEHFFQKISVTESIDAAHDIEHIKRVVLTAKDIARQEGAVLQIVVPAAWLHDFVIVPKSSPLRSEASKMSAEKAVEWLTQIGYEPKYLDQIRHSIEAHSYSAGIEANSLEAKVVCDADRLDAIGAIGLSRCLMLGGQLGRPLYNTNDPFAKNRKLNDSENIIDHFYEKLLKIPAKMLTQSGYKVAQERVGLMENFLNQLSKEIIDVDNQATNSAGV